MTASALKNQGNGYKVGHAKLPRDPITGKVIPGPGRPPGRKNDFKPTLLGKNNLAYVFQMLGGPKGMYDWARSDVKNLTIFYSQIFPKLLSAQSVDAAADKLATRPQLTKIENVIIDPKNDYRSTMIEGEATEIAQQSESVASELERVRQEISQLMKDGGADEELAEFTASQMPIE